MSPPLFHEFLQLYSIKWVCLLPLWPNSWLQILSLVFGIVTNRLKLRIICRFSRIKMWNWDLLSAAIYHDVYEETEETILDKTEKIRQINRQREQTQMIHLLLKPRFIHLSEFWESLVFIYIFFPLNFFVTTKRKLTMFYRSSVCDLLLSWMTTATSARSPICYPLLQEPTDLLLSLYRCITYKSLVLNKKNK